MNQDDDDDLDVIDEEEMVKFQKAFTMPTSTFKRNNFGEETKLLDLNILNITEDCDSLSSDTSVSQPDISPEIQEKYRTTRNITEKKI
jgi:hypothetical protein